MKRIILFVFLQMIWMTGFAENLRFKEFGTHIPAHADLDVRWDAPINALPPKIWVYQLLPRTLSPQIMSNLMTACSFTDKDKTEHGNGLFFNSPNGSRHLRVTSSLGIIDYQTARRRSPTNLVEDVPTERQARKLMTKLLPNLGISLSELSKEENSTKPEMIVYDGGVTYFVDHKSITNTELRGVRFSRAVDGISFAGAGTGGDGDIEFGDHGRISKILLTWRNMQRDKLYPTVTAEMMIKSLREGKAVQGFILESLGDIDWPTVKSVTIKKAFPRYYAGGGRLAPSDWLYPFAALWTTVDTGHGNINVEIDCPIIDETKP
jgi:hypothetical protein